LAAPDRQRHWLSALAAEVIAARAPGPLLDKILLTKRSIMPYCRHGETERV
jgi:hypothetical protein